MVDEAPPPHPGPDPIAPPPSLRPSPDGVPAANGSPTDFAGLLATLTPRAYVTPTLVAANVALFVVMVATGVSAWEPTIQNALDWGANYAPLTTDGQWWRLWTSTFLHFGIIHLAFNMAVLWDAGRTVERMVGNAGYFAMYTISGLTGSLASVAVHDHTVSAGASGAVFGVFGCLGAILVTKKSEISKAALRRVGRDAVLFIGYNLLFGLSVKGIDMAAHVGGLAGGFACGLVLAAPLEPSALAGRAKRALVTAGLGVVVVGVGVAALPRPKDDATQAFARVEAKVIPAYNDLISRARDGTISDQEALAILERDIIPPWSEARAKLLKIDPAELGKKQAARFALLLDYVRLREEGWRLLADGIRSSDPAKTDVANARQAAAEEALKKLNAAAQ